MPSFTFLFALGLFFLSLDSEGAAMTAPSSPLKVGVIQYPIRTRTPEAVFLKEVERFVLQARQGGNELIVLPELLVLDMLDYGDLESEKRQIARLADTFFPRYVEFIQALALRSRITILGGSAPRRVGRKIRNTAFLVRPAGEVLYQDKLFLTPDEIRWGWEGGTELNILPTPQGNWVILICYDSQFAGLSRLLEEAKPSLILIPSMTGDKGLNRVRYAAQARAVEHHAYVVVSSTVSGKSADDTLYVGQNAVIPPQEEGFPELLAQGPRNLPAVTNAILDFQKLERSRKTTGIYSGLHFDQATKSGASYRVRFFGR